MKLPRLRETMVVTRAALLASVIAATFLSIAFIITNKFRPDLVNKFGFPLPDAPIVTGILISIAAASAFSRLVPQTLRYLESDSQPDSLRKLVFQLAEQQKRLNMALQSADKTALTKAVRDSITTEATAEFLSDIKKSVAINTESLLWKSFIDSSLKRLVSESKAQERRSNIALLLGIATGGVGIILLIFLVLFPKLWQKEGPAIVQGTTATAVIAEFLIEFTPRFSLIVIVEVFSYFFLRLYKAGLSEIKYFQNELTNLEIKLTAMKLAIDQKSPELVTEVVKSFLAVERNPSLASGVSTLELEKEKLDQKVVSLSGDQLIGLVRDVLGSAKPNNKDDKPK